MSQKEENKPKDFSPEEEILEEVAEESVRPSDETETEEAPAGDTSEEMDDITVRLSKAEEALAESKNDYLRLVAEYENYRRRTTNEKRELYPEAIASTVSKFLPVLDNFERASDFDRGSEEFAEGFDLIHKSFNEVLESLGVETFGERGEPFNPEYHNAVMQCEDDELPEQCIAMVLQKGYKIGDRIIRHAMVQTAN